MKIAICLYGQPRDYKNGYNCISNLIKVNNQNIYDIFFHCWINDNIKYECSPWRKIDEKILFIENKTVVENDILELYKPISYLFDKPLDKNSDVLLMEIEYIKKSIAYLNSNNIKKNNIYNILSQIYSRSKVKDLFEKYIISTKTNYDMVISTRFDGFKFPKNININKYKKNKIYISSMHLPRYIIPDNFLIIPPEIYINWFDLYNNIKNITKATNSLVVTNFVNFENNSLNICLYKR